MRLPANCGGHRDAEFEQSTSSNQSRAASPRKADIWILFYCFPIFFGRKSGHLEAML
jgi:hypothetical protein